MYKVLIVDDDKTMRYMLKRYKKWDACGFTLEDEACDGKEALKKLAAAHFDLIITDIKMPGMDGIEFLSELKSLKLDHCVILLSTHSDFAYAKQGIRLGAFDYMTKPLEDAVLGEALERAKAHLDEKYTDRKKSEEVYKQLKENVQFYYPKQREKKLVELIMACESEAIPEVEHAFNELSGMLNQDLFKTGMLLETMLANIRQEIYAVFPWLPKIEGEIFDGTISGMASLSDMKSKLLEAIGHMLGTIRKYELHHTDSIVRKTCDYVMNHIEEDIRLDIIANEIHISKDYIGKLFKQKTGTHFNDYVTKVKMEHAKHLIKAGRFKIYEVSEKLGYSKPDYFCRLFKRYSGYTPVEYRKVAR